MSKSALLDSWAWIEIFRDTPAGRMLQERYETSEKIISAINLHEVYTKFLVEDLALAVFARNSMLAAAKVFLVSAELALRAAELRKKYPRFSMADSIIAATAEENNAILVTGDEDFKGVTEIKVHLI